MEGLALIVAAGLAIWRFGFWWGIGIFGVGFFLFTFVEVINAEARQDVEKRENRNPRRTAASARLHAVASGFLAGVLGFGVAVALTLATVTWASVRHRRLKWDRLRHDARPEDLRRGVND